MDKFIMVGCDLHDKTMLLKTAQDRGRIKTRNWLNEPSSRQKMIENLKQQARQAGAARIIFAYEASGSGFVLHDELTAAGIECYVLAPTRMERSVKHRRGKTDDRDTLGILNRVRAYALAGIELPSVWVPDRQTRRDRELVRLRLDVGEKRSKVKTQIRWLLKRNAIEKSMAPASPWTFKYWCWLHDLADGQLPGGAGMALGSLLRQLDWLMREAETLDKQVLSLSRAQRYAEPTAALCRYKGVGVLTAMVYLTELGDLSRFSNRRHVGSFLGLTPSSNESGEADDRKGHITHQGPSRVRKVLCQAVWSRLRSVSSERAAYDRLVARNPKHKKIAVVARMRTMAVRMWHVGLAAQQRVKSAASAA